LGAFVKNQGAGVELFGPMLFSGKAVSFSLLQVSPR
jgi:hypothetical protein